MRTTRRQVFVLGGGLGAVLLLPHALRAASVEVIEMRGSARGRKHLVHAKWPLLVEPGTIIRFINRDKGNSHTAHCLSSR